MRTKPKSRGACGQPARFGCGEEGRWFCARKCDVDRAEACLIALAGLKREPRQ
jgi:hypothetical protein